MGSSALAGTTVFHVKHHTNASPPHTGLRASSADSLALTITRRIHAQVGPIDRVPRNSACLIPAGRARIQPPKRVDQTGPTRHCSWETPHRCITTNTGLRFNLGGSLTDITDSARAGLGRIDHPRRIINVEPPPSYTQEKAKGSRLDPQTHVSRETGHATVAPRWKSARHRVTRGLRSLAGQLAQLTTQPRH